jgi:hypothetical protein
VEFVLEGYMTIIGTEGPVEYILHAVTVMDAEKTLYLL